MLHRGRTRNPDVFLVELPCGRAVVKDFAPRGRLVRRLLAPWIQAREVRAYRALAGCQAVPRFLGCIDRLAFAVEYRPGRRMSRKLAGRVPPDFPDQLERAVRDLHERGVVHLDLRHRSNVLVGDEGRPILIDFASALCLRPGSLLARVLLPLLAALDLRAVRKWRQRLVPQPSGSGGTAASDAARGARRPT